MSEQEIRDMRELDEIAEKAGGYVAMPGKDGIHYDYHKLNQYCKEKGIDPLDLTIRELNQFIAS
jgi:hypothetical protein